MHVGLIGLGNIGTAIANLIASNGYNVLGWEHNQEVVAEINTSHVNSRFLAGVELSPNLVATSDINAVLRRSDVIFIGIPSVFIQKTLEPVRQEMQPATILVNLAKGIDRETGLSAFQTISMLFPQNRRIMLAGPAIANEFAQGMPTVVVLAGRAITDLLHVSRLSTPLVWGCSMANR
jgi:glycerol-3-phosphate dehydrogenase (NAD(P)+)